jgi:hypothetical protein
MLRLQALPGRDPIRALRWLLKRALRQHGLRCLEAREEPRDYTEPAGPAAVAPIARSV